MKRRGFTLVEVLVALTVMAVIAGLAWRGVDGMLRARDVTAASLERTTRLNTVLVQWEQDLHAVFDTGVVPPIAFDGQSLRLSRLVGGDGLDTGVQMVAWALRGGVWTRWAGPPQTKAQALQEQWLASQQLLGNEPQQVQLLDGVDEWQVYFYRDGRKTNAQSTGNLQLQQQAPAASAPDGGASAPGGGNPAPPAPRQREQLPDGVQLVLKLPAGTLTRDVAVIPRS